MTESRKHPEIWQSLESMQKYDRVQKTALSGAEYRQSLEIREGSDHLAAKENGRNFEE